MTPNSYKKVKAKVGSQLINPNNSYDECENYVPENAQIEVKL